MFVLIQATADPLPTTGGATGGGAVLAKEAAAGADGLVVATNPNGAAGGEGMLILGLHIVAYNVLYHAFLPFLLHHQLFLVLRE